MRCSRKLGIPSTLLSKSKARCTRKFSRASFSWGRRILFVGAFLLVLQLTRSLHSWDLFVTSSNPVESDYNTFVEPDSFEQNTIPGRRLLSVNSNDSNTTAHHGPAWERCEFEKAHVPYAWLPLYIFIIFIIFVGIAIICDDFFVPSLEAISEKLDLSEDVAGATFMAAGSSAPELFTSVAGVGTNSDVGVGTIVGSAMFNILTIVALSAVLAGQTLHLDWRPLFRDSVVYSLSIALFIGFSWDGKFEWWEALILLLVYVGYIVLMKFNRYLFMGLVKLECFWCRNKSRIEADEDEVSESGQSSSKSEHPETEDHHPKSVHHDEHKHRFVHSHRGELAGSFANRRRSTSHTLDNHHSQNSNLTHRSEHHKIHGITLPFIQTVAEYENENENHTQESSSKAEMGVEDFEHSSKTSTTSNDDSEEFVLVLIPYLPPIRCTPPDIQQAREQKALGWIKFVLKCLLFVISFPFVVAYSWTIPDCSKNRKWYVVAFSFGMSILWIAITSFVLVTVVARTGCILDIDQFTMGLVVVAVGTSVPDCLSSILVARDGFGDMAVSNAIGSNVFDINLGMGLPFLISICIKRGVPFMLVSQETLNDFEAGEFALIPHAKFGFLLLFVLILAVFTLTLFRFRLNKWTGFCFVTIYILFLIYAFIQELLPGCDGGRRC